ncbi:IS110 family transposase [Streptomyces rugosispiralis]|uniref:IS110 family transposase n=1 Tax=Streptomyces rugosispiralis TaxID=2967341 RepID=A0ABT1UYE4_9ACTN|nr:IS110 family transposase [Streptomyces rugosispiralis]MCQ8190144.1 IS110 family transposase [Streptomyces rugosispiralis]
MRLHLGIDVACRASHRATCTDATGEIQFSGRRFTTTPTDLERLWDSLPTTDDVVAIMEPTSNAWVPLAAWFQRHGAKVVLVPPEQSADLRDYYSKHTKNDRLDSRVLARLPLLHPEGLRERSDTGPANALRRAVRRRSSLVERRTATFYRLDALLELLGPAWADALGTGSYSKAALAVLEKTGADPHALRRLGRKRLAALLIRHSRGQWREEHAERIAGAAQQTLQLWPDGALDFAELAEDIAGEAHMATHLNAQITTLADRITVLYEEADPGRIIASGPGLGVITAAGILGRLGDPNRFTSLAGIRAFTGLVPRLSQSGLTGRDGPPTRQGDPGLRETLFKAADIARHTDPTLAARYHDLVVGKGKHHNSALCTLAATLITRLAACWRDGTLYELRDTDAREITEAEGRQICATRYKINKDDRAKVHVRRRSQRLKDPTTSRREKESPSAPATGPSRTTLRTKPRDHHEPLDVR